MDGPTMSIFRYVYLSLRYDFAMLCALVFGVLIAAAVLSGALFIGDTMRGSLRDLTLDRLGPVEETLTADAFFREELAEDVASQLQDAGLARQLRCVPLILLPGGVKYEENTAGITLLGCSDEFWSLFQASTPLNGEGKPSQWGRGEIVINEALAELLGAVKNGETLSLWVSQPELIPADSALGRKEETVFRKRLQIRDILPSTGLGRFSLTADQKAQPLAIVPLSWLQDRQQLNVPGKVNTLVLASISETVIPRNETGNVVFDFRPRFSDLGIILDRSDEGVFHIKTEKMLFTKTQEKEIEKRLPNFRPALVYLAETIRSVGDSERETPYSLVAAVDELRIGEEHITLRPGEIVLNDWTAEDLGLTAGDSVTLSYFEPQTLYGQTRTQSTDFRVSRVVPMQGDAADAQLVPELHGISDADSLSNWNPPFPFDAKKIRDKDETYWDEHRTSPKAFISLDEARKIWGSRFGETSTFLQHSENTGATNSETEKTEIERRLNELDPAAFGFVFQPVKTLGLRSSAGTTPFQVLFLAFSFFIIASALMLLSLLFQLSIERKATQIGTLWALGFSRSRVLRIFALEGLCISVTGAALGIPLGILYAKLMIYGLHHWWVAAIGTPFLTLHIEPVSVLIGFGATVLLSLAVIFLSLRSLRKHSTLKLLQGNLDETPMKVETKKVVSSRRTRWYGVMSVVCVLCAIVLMTLGFIATDQVMRAGAFFASGAAMLTLCLTCYSKRLRETLFNGNAVNSLGELAASNAARNPKRSVLCIGLLASSCFLVLAVGAFRLDGGDSQSSGAYTYVAETRLPVFFDLNTEEGRDALSMQHVDSEFFAEHLSVDAFRVRSGDSAGCLNLYRPNTPRILGLGERFIEKNRFFGPYPPTKPDRDNPWKALLEPISYDEQGVATVPIMLDANTAMYSLQLYRGVGEIYEIDDGRGGKIRCKVSGLLTNSLLQGDLLMSEKNLLELFPEVGGYRFFLLECPDPEFRTRAETLLTETLGDYGLNLETTTRRLGRLFAVQNTYLSTFRSLGGFGLILGTFGIGVVQLRNVVQRRKELAVLQVLGFSRNRILALILRESVVLLFAGTLIGAVSAVLALLPQFSGSAEMSFLALAEQFLWVCCGMFTIGVLSNLFAFRAAYAITPANALANE